VLKRSLFLSAVLAAGFCGVLYAEDPPATQPATEPAEVPTIPATDTAAIKEKMGEVVTVEGVVESAKWSGTGKVMNVFFKDARDGLIVVVFEKNKENFNNAFDGDVAKAWDGAKVKVTGKIVEYGGKVESMQGRPQIILQNPEQVTVVEAAK
jgi:DNA/RNA endonuclease YhcR with UshA esterase domain